MKSFLSYKSVTLVPLGTKRVSVTGTIFVCKYSSAKFQMNLDGHEDFDMEGGWSITQSPDEPFTGVTIKNLSSTLPLTVNFYVGTSQMQFTPDRQVQAFPSYAIGSSMVNIGSLAQSFGGPNNGNPQKQIWVSNLSTNIDIIIADENGTEMGIVWPRSTWSIEYSGRIILSSSGDAVEAYVGSTFYLL